MNVKMGRQGRGIGRKEKDECEDGRNGEEEYEGKTKMILKMGETGKRNRKERQR